MDTPNTKPRKKADPPRALPATETWLTPAEVYQLTGLPINTLKYWRRKETGPPYTMAGRSVRYRLDRLNAWIDQQPGGGDQIPA